MNRAYKIRLYPTPSQEKLLSKHFGCSRWIYNWGLRQKIDFYQKTKKALSTYSLINQLPGLKKVSSTLWLKEVAAQSLCDSLMRVEKAFINFFQGRTKFPVFKKLRDRHDSFENHSGNSIDDDKKLIYLPKFQEGIRFRDGRKISGKPKKVTVLRTPSGQYYAAFLTDEEIILPLVSEPKEDNALGLDFGLKHLVVTSGGEKIGNPSHLDTHYRRFAILQKRMKRKKKGSQNREKARRKLALLHSRIAAKRAHDLQQIANYLVTKQSVATLCIEDLNVHKMRRTKKRIQWSIQDASWGLLRKFLTYKAAVMGKSIRLIGRFEPSSKTCSQCGRVNESLLLSEREWKCPCGARHDRDVNAAINIKKMAFANEFVSNDKIPKVIRKSTPVEQSVATKQEHSVT